MRRKLEAEQDEKLGEDGSEIEDGKKRGEGILGENVLEHKWRWQEERGRERMIEGTGRDGERRDTKKKTERCCNNETKRRLIL